MTRKASKRLCVLLMALLLFLTTYICLPVNAYATDSNTFDTTNVLTDLRSSDGFNIVDYPFDESKDVKVINFVEYCYSYKSNRRNNYGLYVYVYNPKGLVIDTGNANFLQMAVSYDGDGRPDDYEKFGLKFLSKSEDSNYLNLFYKFKVIDREINGKHVIEMLNSNERRYDVSGIELLTKGKSTATEYGVSATYKFTGYAKGYGSDENAASTLKCDVQELETITLQTHSTYYRTGEYRTNYRHDLTSVYFSVPNRFFDTYGALQKIKAEWYEYETTPIVITSNNKVYDLLYPYLGMNVNSADIPIQIYTGYRELSGSEGHYDTYDWAYNCDYAKVVNTKCNEIDYLFSTEGSSISEYTLSKERLKTYVENYTTSYNRGRIDVPGKSLSADLFNSDLSSSRRSVPYVGNDIHHKLVNIDAGESFDILNYEDTTTAWRRFFVGLFGLSPRDLDSSYLGVEPIHVVTTEDMNSGDIARRLLINGEGVALNEFKAFFNEAQGKNETVVLFRFAQTDYMNLPVMCYNRKTGKNLDKNGLFDSADYGESTYVVSESVFLNFDIIELTFNKKGVYTVIPVVNSPIDVYNDITIPKTEINKQGGSVLKTILFWILVVLILIILTATGILPLVIKAIVYVICLPFRLLGLAIKKTSNAIHKRKERKKKEN